MKAPPVDLDTVELVHALQKYWQLEVSQLDYLAVGFGAHHWRAVTATGGILFLALHELEHPASAVDRATESLARLEQAFGATQWLEEKAQLEFVVGPVLDQSGTCCRRVADGFALSAYPWLDCEPMRHPDDPRTAEILARLHAVARRMPSGLFRIEDFRIPHRAELECALKELDLDETWHTGPYAERARDLLRSHRDGVDALLEFYDAGASRANTSSTGWVVTHGEPFGPNLVQCRDGRLRLVDWDSLLIAPRERDLWDVPRDGPTWATYWGLVDTQIDEHLLRLYRAWYDLAETAVYVALFRSRHQDDQNASTSWDNFVNFLPTHARWPDVVTA